MPLSRGPLPHDLRADDLLAVLRADWLRLRARPGFAPRVLLAVRRIDAAADRPRRLRARFLLGAACAFLVAFVAGLFEAGRGGVRVDAHARDVPHAPPSSDSAAAPPVPPPRPSPSPPATGDASRPPAVTTPRARSSP